MSATKRIIAVIDFKDTDGEIRNSEEAATWIACALGPSAGKGLEITTYTSASEAVADEIAGTGAFGYEADPIPRA